MNKTRKRKVGRPKRRLAKNPSMPKKLGPYREAPDWWKRLVREYLETKRGLAIQMSRDIGHSKGAVSQLLRLTTDDPPGPETSRIATDVAEWTKIPLDRHAVSEEVAELMAEGEMLYQLNPEEVRHAIAFVRNLRRSVQEISALQKASLVGSNKPRGEAHGKRGRR